MASDSAIRLSALRWQKRSGLPSLAWSAELASLKEQVAILQNLVDPDEIAAAQRLRKRRLTNKQLRAWAEQPLVPKQVAKAVEERPW